MPSVKHVKRATHAYASQVSSLRWIFILTLGTSVWITLTEVVARSSRKERWNPPDLSDLISLVTGASYGLGRGIAEVLGECGATVYVTGRSTRRRKSRPKHWPEHDEGHPWTIEETAELVRSNGGRAVAVRCDHRVDRDVEKLFDRIERSEGRLDLLVNNVWGWGGQNVDLMRPTWETPVSIWDEMFGTGLRGHFTSSRSAIPLMLRQEKGLIVHTSSAPPTKGAGFLSSVPYDVASRAIDRMSAYLAHELKKHGISALTVYPGWPRTVNMMEAFEKGRVGMSRKAFFEATESPYLAGRAIASLAADPRVLKKSGGTFSSGQLAREYNFTDVDGRQPLPSW